MTKNKKLLNAYDLRDQAKDENTDAQTLRKLVKTADPYIRFLVSLNPRCPVDILVSLSKTKDFSILEGVAVNDNTPVRILKKLIRKKHTHIIKYTAANLLRKYTNKKVKFTDKQLIDLLCKSSDEDNNLEIMKKLNQVKELRQKHVKNAK